MTKSELKIKLKELNIDTYWCSLDGELLPDRFILYHDSKNWSTFYFGERGKIERKKDFDNESDACEEMLKIMVRNQKKQNEFEQRQKQRYAAKSVEELRKELEDLMEFDRKNGLIGNYDKMIKHIESLTNPNMEDGQ